MITFIRDWRGYAKGTSVATIPATLEAVAVAEGAATYGGIGDPPNTMLDKDGNVTGLVSGDGSFLYGPVTSGTWMKVPSIFRLRITGTGTLQMDSKDSQGNITLATFPLTSYTSETDKIEFPYAGDDAVTIRVTLTGTLTCEVI